MDSPLVPPRRRRLALPGGGHLLAALPAAVIIMFVLILPVGYLIALSFNPARMGVIELTREVTLDNYRRMLSDGYYWSILWRTFWISALTTAIATVFGFLLAVSLWRTPAKWRGLATMAVLAPLLVSIVARTFGWIIILGREGVVNGVLGLFGIEPLSIMYTDYAIVVGMVHISLPYVVLTTLASLDRVDRLLPEAAWTLGASGFRTGYEILLPLATPGLLAGATIVFSFTMSSYVTPAMMGAANSQVLATIIYQQFVVNFSWHFGAVLVAVLIGASMICIAVLLAQTARLARKWGAEA